MSTNYLVPDKPWRACDVQVSQYKVPLPDIKVPDIKVPDIKVPEVKGPDAP